MTKSYIKKVSFKLFFEGDVMLVWRKGNINKNCLCVTVLCTIIMVHKDTSSSYRLVDCIGL